MGLCLCRGVCAPRATLGCFLFPCLMSAGMPLNNLRCTLLGFLCMPTSSLVDNPTLNSRAESRALQQWWGPVSPLDYEEWSSCLNWYSLAALLCMGLYCCTCLKRCVPCRSIKTTSGIMVCSFCGASLCPLQLGQRSSGGYFGPVVLMFLISQQIWHDS